MNQDPKKKELNYEEIAKKHSQHEESWDPLNIHLIPPMICKETYRDLILEIEDLIRKWTWQVILSSSTPQLMKAQLDGYSQIQKTTRKLHGALDL